MYGTHQTKNLNQGRIKKLTLAAKRRDVMGVHVDKLLEISKPRFEHSLFHAERSAVHLGLFIIMGDVVRRREIRAEMDLLTYLVLRRHQRCLKLARSRQETFLRGRTRGWTWPLTPWWTWRRTVTWPPSWEAIWRGGQTQIVNFWRPMRMRACPGERIFLIDWKPTFSSHKKID